MGDLYCGDCHEVDGLCRRHQQGFQATVPFQADSVTRDGRTWVRCSKCLNFVPEGRLDGYRSCATCRLIRKPERTWGEPAPVRNDRRSVHDELIELIKSRKEFGLQKYGTILQPFNGRDFSMDGLEEALDLLVYVTGWLIEVRESYNTQHRQE
jgi:hypothetical protein